MKKAFRAAAIAAILLFALTFIGSAKIKSTSAHLLFSSSVSVGGNESREVTLKSGDRIAIAKLSELSDEIADATADLDGEIAKFQAIEDVTEAANDIRDVILGKMDALRAVCDEAETITAKEFWPFPTYSDLLFSVK